MKKLAFIGNGEPPAKLLELFRKQTPGNSGVWGQLQGVDNYAAADYYMVIDFLPGHVRVDPKKCVFLNAHPETLRVAYKDMSRYTCLNKVDAKDGLGFLEWWIKYDYDTLKALQPPEKTHLLGSIVSNANTDQSHTLRRGFLERFTRRDGLPFDLHGRIQPWTPQMSRYYRGVCGSSDRRGAAASGGNDHMSGKEGVYLSHKYMLEFDNIGKNYFSERVLDCMLLWAMPIYFGGQSVHKYLPPESFRYLNVHGDGKDVVEIIHSGFYEKHLSDLARARNILLDELQLWPRTHQLIFGSTR